RPRAELPPDAPLFRFSPDGTRLAVHEVGGVVAMFDLSGLKPAPPVRHPAERLAALWDDLGAEDADRAHWAVWGLSAADRGQVADLCRARFAASAAGADRVERLIRELDSDDFAVRERASDGLAGMGTAARAALAKALAGNPSPEARRRLSDL